MIHNHGFRITKLEENQYFQEKLLQELNEALQAQQNEINTLAAELQKARRKISELEELCDAASAPPENTRPPHYL